MTARRHLFAGLLLLSTAPAQASGLFVASQGADEVARIEAGADGGAAGPGCAAGPAALAADAAGRLYLSHPDHATITVLAPGGRRVLRQLSYKGQPFGIAADPAGRFVYVGDWSANRVSRISTETGAVEGVVAVGRDPANLVLDRAGRLYVAERESQQISVIDVARMERIAAVPTGQAPFALGLSPAEDRLYVANVRSNDLTVIDTGTLAALATVPAGRMPYGVAVSEDGARILVTNQHAGAVSVLDAKTLAITRTIKVGPYPEGVAVEGGRAYVANWFSNDVSVIDLASLRETGRIRVGEGPRNLCVAADPGESADAGTSR